MRVSGGFIICKNDLVRGGIHSHTGALEAPVSQLDLDAVNAVQATPWRINTYTLDTMMTAWANDVRLPGIEKAITKDLPDKLGLAAWLALPAGEMTDEGLKKAQNEAWAAMPDDDRKEHVRRRADIHKFNASAKGRERAMLDYLGIADEMRDEPAIYFPHNRCFRGRIHPLIGAGPHPQANDMGKSLLMFAEGFPLGREGLFWLCVRAANCGGQDKLSLNERVEWAYEHRDSIVAAGNDPFADLWWASEGVDDPWQLLATCRELALAWALTDPTEFHSHLPVPMDGTCNGLQHLAAMGLDQIGADATNLTKVMGQDGKTPMRQDIYLEVRDAVRAIIETDAAAGHEQALQWHGKLEGSRGRKIVKRAVMTTPYGVTDRGIREQLIKDGHTAEIEQSGPAADYLKDCLVTALSQTVSSAKSIMAWAQTAADRLAKAGLPFEWTTPSGSTVRQAYHLTSERRVKTLSGSLVLHEEMKDAGLNSRKQAAGAAPNLIHSFDAAHLSMTVAKAAKQGIKAFSMIHDSYGTHAGNTGKLSRILRETFVDIYSTDQLARVRAEIATQHPHVDLPTTPARGTFEVSEVLTAPFFFS